jgi:hypothetical protein
MANQPKTAKQLENELQALIDGAKKIERDLAEARKVEAEKTARLKAANEKRAKKVSIKRKAELDTILLDYEDVVVAPVVKKVSVPSNPTQVIKQPVATVIKPAPKQEVSKPGFFEGLFGQKKEEGK